MDNLFYSRDEEDDDVENVRKINLDELYDKKKEKDLQKLQTFNRILNRIHEKIKMTSRQKLNSSFCWYVVPEVMLGYVNYDRAMCISYVLAKLEENDFQVRYTHPNLIFISWGHYIPTYVRNEFKKKTGIEIDESGDLVPNDDADEGEASKNPFSKNGNGSGSGSRGGNNSSSAVGGMKANMNTLLYKNGKTANPALAEVAVKKKEYTPINSYKPTGKFIYNESLFQHIQNKTGES